MQILFDVWWASINVGSKRPVAWYNSCDAPLCRFYLHCGIEESVSPGIICNVCHQVLCHPSEHGTSSMGKCLLAKAHIAKLNELTESDVTELTISTVDEPALAILKRQGSRGITIVSLQRKVIFNIQFNPYWPKWQTKCSKLAPKHFEPSKFRQDMWNRYHMLGFHSANIPWKAISNLGLWRSYEALCYDLVLPSAMIFHNISSWKYALTEDAIKKQLPLRNKVSLALDGWTSTNKLAISSVMAYYMDRECGLPEIHLTFNEVDRLFFSHFES